MEFLEAFLPQADLERHLPRRNIYDPQQCLKMRGEILKHNIILL